MPTSPTTSSCVNNWLATCCPPAKILPSSETDGSPRVSSRSAPRYWPKWTKRKWKWTSSTNKSKRWAAPFLALTFGCARCHDHKFDPVSTEDYYALAGIFKSTQTMEHFTKIARWHEVSLALPDQQAAFDAAQAHVKQLEADLAETKRRLETGQKAATSGGGKEAAETCQSREQTVAALERKLAEARQQIPELPLAMGVRDYPAPTDLPIHIRGSHLTLGDVVPRRTPPALAAGGSTRSMPPSASGRRELSDWLVGDCRHLTARVMVNRLWRWHFGQGLVRSTDNFGRLAAPPVNADLLDWLAARLIEENWSLKAIQRLILSSQTYQLSSDAIDASQQVDPGNIHHWRANVRRLEAEAIRDSWLAISGQLDPTMGGSLLHVKNREFLFDHTSKDGTRYDVPRRSIYLPVIRNHLYDLFQLFDYVDESVTTSDRATTTVARKRCSYSTANWFTRRPSRSRHDCGSSSRPTWNVLLAVTNWPLGARRQPRKRSGICVTWRDSTNNGGLLPPSRRRRRRSFSDVSGRCFVKPGWPQTS